MKFKFPLQKVMEHRKVKEDLAQKDFQEAVAYFTEQQNKLQKLEQDQHDAQVRAGALASQGGQQGPALSQIHEFLQGQKVRVANQKVQVGEAEKLVEARREILKQAVQDHKIIEKMRENKFEEYRAKRLSDDQKEMDEQSILRFKRGVDKS